MFRHWCLLLLGAGVSAATAQTLTPNAVVPAGGSSEAGGTTLSWTLGQPSSTTYVGDAALTAGVQQPEGVMLSLSIAALLDGPYDTDGGLMHDSLRVRGLIPAQEPYSAMSLGPVGIQVSGTLASGALATIGPDAVVDWVLIELRDASDPAIVRAARTALLQRDGDVRDNDGASPLRMHAPAGSYRVAVRHRNHLPVMTLHAIALGAGANSLNLTDGSVPVHLPDAQVVRGSAHLLWCGDVSGDGSAQYTGSGNDRDPILQAIGGSIPTSTATGYLPTDVNLDGTVKYTGADNDRDPILQTIGGSVPTNVRSQPLP